MRSLRKLMGLQGRVALVTGGAGKVGSAICDALAELGAGIVVLDVIEESCVAAAKRIHDEYGVEAMPLIVDLSDEAAVRAVPERIADRLGRLDVLINCAALVGTSELKGWVTPFEEQSSDTWRLALETNLTAPFVLVQACAKELETSGHGSIINIGSIYGVVGPNMRLYEGTGMGNPAAYAASKGGLMQLTRWLATVLAPAIRVNAVSLGGIRREKQDPSFRKRYEEDTPLARMATEEDIKGAVAYLASDLSSYVTGHNLSVDGGWTVW